MAAWASSRKRAPRSSPATCAFRRSTRARPASRARTLWAASCRTAAAAAFALLDEVAETARNIWQRGACPDCAGRTGGHRRAAGDGDERPLAGSVPYARAFALTLGGHYHRKGRDGRPAMAHARLAASLPRAPAFGGARALSEAVQGGCGSLFPLAGRSGGVIRYPFENVPRARCGGRGRARHPLDAPAAAHGAGPRECLRAAGR
jgi:hypothetical protein